MPRTCALLEMWGLRGEGAPDVGRGGSGVGSMMRVGAQDGCAGGAVLYGGWFGWWWGRGIRACV